MMKDYDIKDSKFEDLLKNKMNELADCSNCFDKISKRAFPEKNAEFEFTEYTVSELENVTGKKKGFRLIPVFAVAAAAAVCLFFLPKNENFMNFIYSNIWKSDSKETFREIISEIKEETEKYDYDFYDITLDEYVSNDALITPLYGCPFEAKNKEDINVRIFVKTIGDYHTNQVYAVEYEGNYDDNNFIAAADSWAKFTPEELEAYKTDSKENPYSINFNESPSYFRDSNGNSVNAVETIYQCIFKYQNEIFKLGGQMIYYKAPENNENYQYLYDITGTGLKTSNEKINLESEMIENSWKHSVYYTGNSAAPSASASKFCKADIYSKNNSKSSFYSSGSSFTEPLESIAIFDSDDTLIEIMDMPLMPEMQKYCHVFVNTDEINVAVKTIDGHSYNHFSNHSVNYELYEQNNDIHEIQDILQEEEAQQEARKEIRQKAIEEQMEIESDRMKALEEEANKKNAQERMESDLKKTQEQLDKELEELQKNIDMTSSPDA